MPSEPPAAFPLAQLVAVESVRRDGTNTLYAPAPSTYRKGFSRTVGVWFTVV